MRLRVLFSHERAALEADVGALAPEPVVRKAEGAHALCVQRPRTAVSPTHSLLCFGMVFPLEYFQSTIK